MGSQAGGEQAANSVHVLTPDQTAALAELACQGAQLAQRAQVEQDRRFGYAPRKPQGEASAAWEVDHPGV